MATRTIPDQIKKLEQQAERYLARARALQAKEKEAERRRDTRCKIVLGGALLRQAREEHERAKEGEMKGPPVAGLVLNRAIARLEQRDRRFFKGHYDELLSEECKRVLADD